MATDRSLPDWDDNQISLGKPECMSTPTLIEWIQRQLETPEETRARHDLMKIRHRIWHENTHGIYACCITSGIITVNEHRSSERLMQQALEAFKGYQEGS